MKSSVSATKRSATSIILQQFLGKGEHVVASSEKEGALTVTPNPSNPFYVRIVFKGPALVPSFLRTRFDTLNRRTVKGKALVQFKLWTFDPKLLIIMVFC